MVMLQADAGIKDNSFALMADGRCWGPFENAHAARQWERYFTKPQMLATAREIFEGSAVGDAYFLVSPFGIEFGVHPFTEVYDWFVQDDNGRVVADLAGGTKMLDPETPVLVHGISRRPRARKLMPPVKAPELTDITGPILAEFPSRFRGEMVVVPLDGGDLVVAWREDGRVRRNLPVLSRHSIRECAVLTAEREADLFEPPLKRKSRRIRDYQKNLVYKWENSFPSEDAWIGNIEGCRELVGEICSVMGIEPPKVSLGRSTLTTHSYHSMLKGIVLSSAMLQRNSVIHELAHYIVKNDRGPREASHGPRFTGTLAGMLALFANADVEQVILKARELGVDIDEDLAMEIADSSPTLRP